MNRVSRFWASNAIGLGVWEAAAITTHKVPTVSNTAVMARKRWPRRTLVFLLSWCAGLVTYLYTKEIE
jgi:hypothetical protein